MVLRPLLLAVLASAAPLAAQQRGPLASPEPGLRVAPAPAGVLARYELRSGMLQELELRSSASGGLRADVLLGERIEALEFRPREIRTASFQLRVETPSGWTTAPRDACVTYRGAIDRSGALVAATWDPRIGERGYFEACVLDGDESWYVQPLEEAERAALGYGWIVHRGADRLPSPASCGALSLPGGPIGGAPESIAVLREAELALDADREFYQRKGSNLTQTQTAILSIVNSVDLIYRRDLCIQYFVGTLFIRTTNVYTQTDMGALLGEFQGYWVQNHANVVRDVAHLFTGKGSFSGTIGIAYVGAVCDRSTGFAVSRAYSSSNASNIELVAHELGHNWGASHCSGSGCLIMCPSLGSCGGLTNRFDAPSAAAITAYANAQSCLRYANGVPVLQSAQPATAQAWGGATIHITGAGFLGTQSATIGGSALPLSSIYVQSDTQLDLRLPQMTQVGALPLVITNGNGSSNALPLQIVPTSPPRLEVTPLVAIQGQTVSWRFGGDSDDLWSLAITVNDPTTIQLFGDTVLAAGYPIFSGVLSPAGLATLVLPGVPRQPGLTVYSQIWTLSNTSASWGGASNIATTVFF
ncbi:MAG: IPT/TIG domain-containing protein [Planctomycetes bacterium]|nr:IPT/TIG domain-containing protein [Planctomycetota bacterium]